MSYQSQSENMRALSHLMSQDLSYIWGERESGPNGAKKQFLDKGRAFLHALAKDLKFIETKVYKNPAGIAASGEITLMGMWSEGSGLYIQLCQHLLYNTCIMYRKIKHLKDFAGGQNHFVSISALENGNYEMLVSLLSYMKEAQYEFRAA